MDINIKNKKVLITGGTKGIGADIALIFAENGGDVYITGTRDSSFLEFKNKFTSVKVTFMAVDFSIPAHLENFLVEIEKINFDILVNNAGINKIDSIGEIALQDWQKIQDVNVKAPFLIAQTVVKSMKQRKWGRIINIASVFGVVTKEKRLSYTTSKAAVIGMTKTMALDLAADNILVNAISPGFIDTELTRNILGVEGIKEMVSKVPLQRLGKTSDVSGIILFLASEQNGFITGQNIIIDGGFTCA